MNTKIPILKYTGSKHANGIYQWIINDIPVHDRYFELYAGSGAIYYRKKPAKLSVLSDINQEVIAFHNCNCRPNTIINDKKALALIDENVFTADDFMYLDPPYPFDSRRQNRHYYKNEMSDNDHIQLLSTIRTMDCKIMISTKENSIYTEMLHDWRLEKFLTADRVGSYYECRYMNYDKPTHLHDYQYIGKNFTDRQRISRKVNAIKAKLNGLPDIERNAIISAIIEKFNY